MSWLCRKSCSCFRGLNCWSTTWAFVEVQLWRKNQGDVRGNPGAAQCEGCRRISLCFSVTCLSLRQSNKVTDDGIQKYSWSLWLCWAQSGDPPERRVWEKCGLWRALEIELFTAFCCWELVTQSLLLLSSGENILVTSLPENEYWDLFPSFTGNGSALVRLLQEENLRLEMISSYSEAELQSFLTQCDIPWKVSDTKVMSCLPTYTPAGAELFFTVLPSFTTCHPR